MAEKFSNDRYRPGGFWRIDDRSGERVRNWDTSKEWNGAIVSKESWETRQPQDFVRGIPDIQTVPDARPPSDLFVGPFFTLMAANAFPGDDSVVVEDVSGFTVGDFFSIFLDTGDRFLATISSLSAYRLVTQDGYDIVTLAGDSLVAQSPGSQVINFYPPLPLSASIGVEVISYTPVVSQIAA
jgi:hypothetical protein